MHGGERLQIADRRGLQTRGSEGGKGGKDTGGKSVAGKRERFHLMAFKKTMRWKYFKKKNKYRQSKER
jgi:hypothetical protein